MEGTIMEQGNLNSAELLESFKTSGGWYDPALFSLKPIEGMGYGGIALSDIPANTPLFHIPLDLLLTPWTSSLKSKLTSSEWESLQGGWAALILSMMYETSLESSSKWAGYLRNMPTEFDTPMFWSEEEKKGLVGTDIQDRIGKEDAEADYESKILPILQAHPDLFPPTSAHFTLQAYHLQGSRILSRSFTIPLSRAGGPKPTPPAHTVHDEDEEDEEEEEMTAVMVPMADMLNAGYEVHNASLFADDEDVEVDDEEGSKVDGRKEFGVGYTMISTKEIKAGEQIYNTYSSPPNAELLRKYGHVDTLPLPETVLSILKEEEIGGWPFGNPGDEVELRGDKIVDVVKGDKSDRVDWWLEDGQDDTFGITYETPLDPALVSFIRLLIYDAEWARTERKGKIPNPIIDKGVLEVLDKVLDDRLGRYEASIMHAELEIINSKSASSPANPAYNSAVLRLGEKRLLHLTKRVISTERERVQAEEESSTGGGGGGGGKRKADKDGGGKKKIKSGKYVIS